MLRDADQVPLPALPDLVRAALEPCHHLRLKFNPFLTEASCQALKEASLLWLQLCVLEDRLERIEGLAGAADKEDDPTLIRVRADKRVWPASPRIDVNINGIQLKLPAYT